MSEKTFFLKASQGHMTLKDIFSDVGRKHTPDETARVFIAGTSLTTPSEAEMLAGWQKPFLFARFFLVAVLTLVIALVMPLLGYYAGYDILLVGLSAVVPFTILLLTWEMNIPRSISLAEVLRIVAVGGALSLLFTMVFNMFNPLQGVQWAPVTEEPAKLIIILLLLRKKNYKYITEGILLGMAVGTGFAIMETLNYVMNYLRTDMVLASINNLDAIAGLYLQGYSIEEITLMLFDSLGASTILSTAILRAVNAVAGHGMLAAFYGGGILMAKGSQPFQGKHLLDGRFLKYFAISFLLHFLNNFYLTSVIFPTINIPVLGPVWTYSFVQTVVAIALFLPLLRQGVNQVVTVTLQHNVGLTMAIDRNDQPSPQAPQHRPQQSQYQQSYHQASAPTATAVVQFLSGPNAGKSYRLNAGRPVSMGRTPGQCGLAMPSCNKVSSRHCTLELRGRTILLTDLNSTNGTYIDSRRIQPNVPAAVSNGSVVSLGNQNCSFRVFLQ